jgi:hypothetical protein
LGRFKLQRLTNNGSQLTLSWLLFGGQRAGDFAECFERSCP